METRYLKEWGDDLHRCIRCGYCFEGCPVYRELDWEVDGARGKMVIAYGLMVGDLEASAYVAEKLFQCTFCRDCVERCSAQVSVPDILAAARADLWSSGFGYDSHKVLLNKVTASGNIFDQKLAPPPFKGEQAVLLGCRLLGRFGDAEKYLHLLKKLGVEPKTFDEVCCGMPYGVLGDKQGFQNQQKTFRETIPNKDEAIICACTTCVFFLRKKYPELKARYIVEEIILHQIIDDINAGQYVVTYTHDHRFVLVDGTIPNLRHLCVWLTLGQVKSSDLHNICNFQRYVVQHSSVESL